MVVVMSFGSSAEPIGAGSTYFSVVKSTKINISNLLYSRRGLVK